jgi:AraC-like DNA-binding protein/CheY-like chemotaxis protein
MQVAAISVSRMANKNKLPVLWVDCAILDEERGVPGELHQHFEVTVARFGSPVTQLILEREFAAVFIDYDYPDRDSLRFAVMLKRSHPALPMFTLMVQHSEELAVWALRSHMADYIVKPIRPRDVARVVHTVQETWRLRRSQPPRGVQSIPTDLPAEARVPETISQASLLAAIYYVRQHYRDKIRLEEVAEHCGMKAHQLSRLFHVTYGLTFRDYVVRYRLREAKRLLRDPQVSISEVAEAVGFNDVSYFSRMFKRHFGRCPSIVHGAGHRESEHEADSGTSTTRMLKLPVID